MDAGAEQGLVGIDVTHPGHDMAVHDELLDGQGPVAACMEQVIPVKQIFQRFRSESRKKRVAERLFTRPERQAEAARIGEAQRLSARQDDIQVVVPCRRGGGRDDTQMARHAEMENDAPRGRAQQEILAAPFHLEDCPAGEFFQQFPGDRQAQFSGPGDHLAYPDPLQIRRDSAPGYLHLRQFRHEYGNSTYKKLIDISDVPPSPATGRPWVNSKQGRIRDMSYVDGLLPKPFPTGTN